MKIEVPYHWTARDYQVPLLQALESGVKKACCIWHRRAGKDLAVIAGWTARQAFLRPGLYWHVLPTYKQGRKIAWDGMTGDRRNPRKFRSFFPPQMILRERDDEMTMWLANHTCKFDGAGNLIDGTPSVWSVVGTDDIDRLVGANPVGVVFSEFALHRVEVRRYIRPILAENGGWEVVISTPRGKNHLHALLTKAQARPDKWFTQILTVDDTKREDGTPVVTQQMIQDERDDGMPEEIIAQEFYCSFDAALEAGFYTEAMVRMRAEGRICTVPHDDNLLVHTAWDLGIDGDNAIWAFQVARGNQVRWLEAWRDQGKALSHHASVLHKKREENRWTYGEHLLPHDAAQRDLSTAQSRRNTLRDLGIPSRLVERGDVANGIDLTRSMLNRSIMDEDGCEIGIQALEAYERKSTGLYDPDGEEIYDDKPAKKWCNHLADAARTAAMGMRPHMNIAGGTRPTQKRIMHPRIAMV